MFEKASRQRMRFATKQGLLTVEDLWSVPLTVSTATSARTTSLDQIAMDLNVKVNESNDMSFVVKKTKASQEYTLAFDIVKHIIAVRLSDIEANQNAEVNKQKKDKLMNLIAEKKDNNLAEKSLEELEKMVAEL